LTRFLAIGPAVVVILVAGEKMVDELLVFSQVLLSMQLGFAVIPLIHFVSDKQKMGAFTIGPITRVASLLIATVILALNIKLFLESVAVWVAATPYIAVKGLIVLFVAFIAALLLYTIFYPFFLKRKHLSRSVHAELPKNIALSQEHVFFSSVALALDFSDKDQKVIAYALRLAKENTNLVLIHIVESASARVMGKEADDFETVQDKAHLEEYTAILKSKGYNAIGVLGFKNRVEEIARIVTENKCELLVMGSHGHKTAKDWLFGETINSVRHKVKISVFIAQ
jgi:manganese transport protein